MTDKNLYPELLQPHGLQLLNDEAIKKLGTPIFFAVVEPSRPRARSNIGRLYEVVTGLYVVYKDYGMQIFQTFLDFCKQNIREKALRERRSLVDHIVHIKDLRGGLCHGNFIDGDGTWKLLRTLGIYLPQADITNWPECMYQLSDCDCQKIVCKIIIESNELVSYIRDCIDWLALPDNKAVLTLWRKTLVEKALNPDKKQYTKERYFFDQRIVMQFELPIRRGMYQKNHGMALQQWLRDLKPRILNAEINQSNELQQTLIQALENLYHPTILHRSISSADTLMGDW